jgi:hypothetical protein
MPSTYLDQNALIRLGQKARDPEFRKKVDVRLESGELSVVLSLWHLVETTHTGKLDRALELARFIASLNTAWLHERHDILKMEVADDFYKFAHVENETAPRIATLSAIFAALHREPDAPRFNIPVETFVTQWWSHPEDRKPLEVAYQNNIEALVGIRELRKTGKLTEAIRNETRVKWFEHTTPTTTPAGLEVGREVRHEYIQQAKEESIPTMSIEAAISEQEWDAQGGDDKNTIIDKFHVIPALPYVDEIVTNDHFFDRVLTAVSQTGYVKAKLVSNDEFLKQFD